MDEKISQISKSLTVMILWLVVGGLITYMVLISTSPRSVGYVGVTAWFLLLFSWLVCLLALAGFCMKSYFKLGDSRSKRMRNSRRQGVLIAGWIVAMLALSSLGQLSWQDAIITGLLLILVEVYVRLRWL